jgi:hypothetical protein
LSLLPIAGSAMEFLSAKSAARINCWQQRQADITAEL